MADEAKGCNFELPLPSRDTFKTANPETQSLYLFDLLCVALDNQNVVRKYIEDDRIHWAKNKRIIFGLSAGSGAVISFVISVAKYIFGIHV